MLSALAWLPGAATPVGNTSTKDSPPLPPRALRKNMDIDVEFVLNDDVDASLNAWKAGDIDLHWYTIDAFPTILDGLKDYDPVALWQADWSRGGDAIVARRGINSVGDLRGQRDRRSRNDTLSFFPPMAARCRRPDYRRCRDRSAGQRHRRSSGFQEPAGRRSCRLESG